MTDTDTYTCTDCHKFHDGELGSAPDLTGYGSAKWLTEFIGNPNHSRFYGDKNDRMPAFAEHPTDPSRNSLSKHEFEMLVRWLRGDDRDLNLTLRTRQSTHSEASDVPSE